MKKQDIKPGMYLKNPKSETIILTSKHQTKDEECFSGICIKNSYYQVYESSHEWAISLFEPITFSQAFKEEIEKEFEATLNEFTKEKLDLVERNQELQNELNELNQKYNHLNRNYNSLDISLVAANKKIESLQHELKETIVAYDELENKKFDTVTVSTATKINSLTESNRKLQQENSKLKNALVKMILEGSP